MLSPWGGYYSNHLGTQSDEIGACHIQRKVAKMRKEYDFSKAKRNPYAKYFKKQVTIRLDETTISYFKKMADELGMPYQTLINLYLRDCASTGRRLSINWVPAA